MSDPIRDELHRLVKEFKKLLEEQAKDDFVFRSPSKQLFDFGLTEKETKAWLESEPDFQTTRRIFTDHKSDEEFTEPELCEIP